jgi:hypothetical protein
MITLKLPTHKIRIALGEAANTELGCYAGFKEWGSGVSNNNDLALVLTSGDTPKDFIAPPNGANLQRDIHKILIYNRDNISHRIIIYYNVNGTDYPLEDSIVLPSGKLRYTPNNGFEIIAPQTGNSSATPATTGTMTVPMDTDIKTITPTGACTFNATGGYVGRIVTFHITTNGTSSFTLTFGTNFRKTGTLATGTTSARFFSVTFRCLDGTTWTEIARTAVQT